MIITLQVNTDTAFQTGRLSQHESRSRACRQHCLWHRHGLPSLGCPLSGRMVHGSEPNSRSVWLDSPSASESADRSVPLANGVQELEAATASSHARQSLHATPVRDVVQEDVYVVLLRNQSSTMLTCAAHLLLGQLLLFSLPAL